MKALILAAIAACPSEFPKECGWIYVDSDTGKTTKEVHWCWGEDSQRNVITALPLILCQNERECEAERLEKQAKELREEQARIEKCRSAKEKLMEALK